MFAFDLAILTLGMTSEGIFVPLVIVTATILEIDFHYSMACTPKFWRINQG